MDDMDRELLDLLQYAFPLEVRPFAVLGEALELEEAQILARVRRLQDEGLIRRLGPIFDSRRLGYDSTLAAFRVPPERLDEVADQVSQHPGVSHNYARTHPYNLWFTLTLPRERDLRAAIARMARENGVEDFLHLPSLRVFKIGVQFSLSDEKPTPPSASPPPSPEPAVLSDFEREVVRALQGPLPVVERPFAPAAAHLGISEEELVEKVREFDREGVIRRVSAVLRHRRAGFTANGMACWAIPEEQIEHAGQTAAAFPEVSHCYHRPAYPPDWPYTLFTMVHGREQEEVEAVIERIHQVIGPVEHSVLYSTKEYKKQRVRYFENTKNAETTETADKNGAKL
jgi:DNA-binding Lrp family transcriptional regulator